MSDGGPLAEALTAWLEANYPVSVLLVTVPPASGGTTTITVRVAARLDPPP
jgi:hypothetical protein